MQITDAKVIAGRLSKVRDIMKSEGVDIYVVVTGDYHISEYAGDYFKEREFITGFTGSAGTAVITQDDARLFTDGRYFVQAEKQIEGTGFSLMRVGAPGVMNVAQYCESIVKDGMSMGFDGRTMPAEEGIELSPEARIGLSSANSTEVVGNRSGQIEDLDKWKIVTADEMKKQ